MDRRTRRAVIRAATAAGIAGLAGCTGDGDGGPLGDDDPDDVAAWSQYRGEPGNAGTASDAGPGSGLEVEWEWELEPPEGDDADQMFTDGTTSLLVADGMAYVVASYEWLDYDDGSSDAALRLFAVDVEAGETAWTVELPTTFRFYPYPPATDGERVYTYGVGEDGVRLLGVDLGAREIEFDVALGHDLYTGFTLADETLYVGGETVHAYGTEAGESEWDFAPSTDGERATPTQITPPTVAGDVVYVGVGPDLLALDRATGDVRWRVEAGHEDPLAMAGGLVAVHSPVLVGDALYLTSGRAVLRSDGAMVALDPTDGSERWRYQPPVDEDRTGRAVGEPVASAIYGVPTPGSDALYAVGAENGDPHLFAVGTDGDLVWSEPIDWYSLSPILADGLLYLPTEESLTVFDAADGSQRGHVDLPATPTPGLFESPVVVGDRLLVPVRRGLVSLRG